MGTTVKLTPADRLEDRIAEVQRQLSNAEATLAPLSELKRGARPGPELGGAA